MRRLIVAAVVFAVTQVLVTHAAGACKDCQEGASGESTQTGGAVEVRTTERSGGSGSAPSGGGAGVSRPVTCKVFAGVPDGADSGGDIPTEIDASTISPGTVVWQTCADAVTGEYVYSGQFAWGGGAGVPYVPPEVLARRARSQLDLPRPAVRTWPVPDAQVVNVPTWLHVDNFDQYEQTATVGAVTATVHAQPVSVQWEMGDGAEVTCASAGDVFDDGSNDSSDCSHSFDRTSAGETGEVFHGSVSIEWHLSWDSNVGDSGDLGSIVMTAPADWRVEQIESLIDREGRRS